MATGNLIVSLRESGTSWREIGEKLNMHPEAARSLYRRTKDGGTKQEPLHEIISKALLDGPKSLGELSTILDRSAKTVLDVLEEMKQIGYSISQSQEIVTIPRFVPETPPPPALFTGKAVTISFAVVSDTHAGSRAEQVTALHDFVHIAREEHGVQHIFHVGDAFAGHRVYRGQEADVYAVTGAEQSEVVANNLPQHSDLTWYLLGGNHDYSFYRTTGYDIRRSLKDRNREDIVLLNYDTDEVPLLEGISVKLWHPSGGPAYALSYRGQKYAEQIAFQELFDIVKGDKPAPTVRVILIGHFHSQFYFSQGPIKVVGAGCFEGETNYLKRKGLTPYIGGHVFSAKVVDGLLHQMMIRDISYREIENDWQHRWSARKRQVDRQLSPIFSMTAD